ncbi:MAG: CHRD domain-containing protein [Nocardioides sp.]
MRAHRSSALLEQRDDDGRESNLPKHLGHRPRGGLMTFGLVVLAITAATSGACIVLRATDLVRSERTYGPLPGAGGETRGATGDGVSTGRTGAAASKNARVFDVVMRGENEVDAPNAADRSVTVEITVDPESGQVGFDELRQGGALARGVDAVPTMFHLHQGTAGTNGAIVADFTRAGTAGEKTGTRNILPAVAAEIVADPAAFYLNYHSANFPDGAARGQLAGGSIDASAATDDAEPRRRALSVSLSGAQVVPAGTGDPDGSAAIELTLIARTGAVEFRDLRTGGVFGGGQSPVPTALHLHRGGSGTNGGVVVDLTAKVSDGQRVGCGWADPAVVRRIIDNPENYYLDLHSAGFPGGAARGQLAA